MNGDLDDVLNLLELLIDLPHYPISFHCQGGRHKTGKVAIALQCLADSDWFYEGPKKTVPACDHKKILPEYSEGLWRNKIWKHQHFF